MRLKLRRSLRRFVLEFILLIVLAILNIIDQNVFLFVVAVALLLIPPVNWTVAAILIWTSRQAPGIRSLKERADDAVTLGLISSSAAVAGGIALVNILGFKLTGLGRPSLVLLAFALILVSVPAIDWLRTWREVWLPALSSGEDKET